MREGKKEIVELAKRLMEREQGCTTDEFFAIAKVMFPERKESDLRKIFRRSRCYKFNNRHVIQNLEVEGRGRVTYRRKRLDLSTRGDR
jgi:hypothetical protein